MRINGKVALVTGGARIGGALARALAEKGADVALTYRASRRAALETLKAVEAFGRRGLAVRADLSRDSGVDRAVAAVQRKYGGVDILVHLASVYEQTPMNSLIRRPRPLAGGPGAVDLEAAWRLSLRLAPIMKKRGGGRIVLFSDWTAAGGRPRYKGVAPYYAAKAGAKALAEALALELAPDILVNSVAPGPILPPEGLNDRDRREATRQTPLGRWGGAEEITKAVLFFIESNFVTGECLRVDGGRHLL